MTDQEIFELRDRNAARLEEVKKNLGNKWLCHPDNYVKKKEQKQDDKKVCSY